MARQKNEGHVLLVDDEDPIREAMGELLEACGFTVAYANCVKKAIEVLDSDSKIEAVVSDMKMPGESGLGVLKHINEKNLGVSVIFLTGFGTLETCQEAVKEGAFDYLLKPIDNKDRIVNPLNNAITKRRLEIKNAEMQMDIIKMAEEHQALIEGLLMDAEMKDKVQDKISQILDKWKK